jgi:hypothetical protein
MAAGPEGYPHTEFLPAPLWALALQDIAPN